MDHESFFPIRVSIQGGDQVLERMREYTVAAGNGGAQLTADEIAGMSPVVSPPLIQGDDWWPLPPERGRVSGRTVNCPKPAYQHAPTGIEASAERIPTSLDQLDFKTGYRRTLDFVDEFDRRKI